MSRLSSIAGFSPDSLAGRIVDADSKFIVTADEGVRGGRPIPLKKNTDEALKKCKGDEKVLVVLEGRAAGEALGKKGAPVDAAIVGIIDTIDVKAGDGKN